MKCVVFENDGVIDPIAIRTFGVSAKDCENPIGFFGTGMKYAIAIIMRHGLSIEIRSGLMTWTFSTAQVRFRDKDVEFIRMNGEDLPFTTHLGKKWELWQAFRELYCNCLDEKGSVRLADAIDSRDGSTQIIVRGDAFVDLYFERGQIVLDAARMPCVEDGPNRYTGDRSILVYNVPSTFLYYRGIKVWRFDKPAMFTYNIIQTQDLTEDRSLKNPSNAVDKIPLAIAALSDREVIRKVLTAEEEWMERDMSFVSLAWYEHVVSDEFKEVLSEEYNLNNDRMNKSAREHHMKLMNKKALKNYVDSPLTDVERKQLERAQAICKRVFPDFDAYKVKVVTTLGQSTMALADHDARAMVIAKPTFGRGTKYLVSTLIEEYMHLKTGFGDCTRMLQTHLFDTICTLVEDHILEEPI